MCDTSVATAIELGASPSVTSMAAAVAAAAEQTSSASAILAKRERRLRLEKVGSYRVGRTLGRGNFAQVRIAYHEIANAKVAMKIVDRRSLDAENLAKIEREIQILQQLSHPYIVRLYEVIRTERFLYIVTEYVANGELFDMLMDRGRQTESESRRLFQQIVSAVAYCHAHGVVHRDLKAENLLLDKRGNIKIIDFGFSNYQQPGQLLSTWCGSPPYAAPELLLAQEYDGRQSDVWSLGVILYILVTAGFPFPGDSVDKLKRAVLGDHLKIPFWVSVECADLIRKMLTVLPAKRCTLQHVIQHRWMAQKMPEPIKRLFASLPATQQSLGGKIQGAGLTNNVAGLRAQQLDPTVLVFMQQHTGWSDEQITEEVLNRNYESPIFATYELLLTRLSEFRDAEMAALSNGTSNLQLESDQMRRGSRGSIISGRANVEPEQLGATIPAHHLAKLTLATNPDYGDSDDSDSASDLGGPSDDVSPRYPQQAGAPKENNSTSYKSTRRHRAYRRARGAPAQPDLSAEGLRQSQQRLTYALEQYHQLNPLLNAAAQQFAVDTTRAWANAAAAAALFASQLQQQRAGGGATQQQLQQAAALNLVSLQNFPFVDYARMMHVPNQERRASANEALLGLNSYAHLLAACSTMGMGTGGADAARCSSSQGTSSSPRQPQQPGAHRSAYNQQPRRSVEEEGEFYLSQRGSSKRNTVHSITGGISLLATGGIQAPGGGAGISPFARHSRTTPYFKQQGGGSMGGAPSTIGGAERRSSWASSASASSAAALAINAQQQAQLERIYRQSIGQTGSGASSQSGGTSSTAEAAALSGVQQLQLEFQKLCASTKEGSPVMAVSGNGTSTNAAASQPSPFASAFTAASPLLFTAQQQQQSPQMPKAPTISITDENNQNLGAAFAADAQTQQHQQIISFLAAQQAVAASNMQNDAASSASGGPFSQSLPHAFSAPQSPASVDTPSTPISLSNQQKPAVPLKCVYIPVSIQTALERLQRVVQAHQLLCELQSDELNGTAESVNSIKIRVAPANEPVQPTILELALQRMEQSPNISRAAFFHIQGDSNEFEVLRHTLLAAFNEVL